MTSVAFVNVHVVATLAGFLGRVLNGVIGMHAVAAVASDGLVVLVFGQGVRIHYRAVSVGEDGASFGLSR